MLSEISAGPSQREGLLSQRLDKFTRAMYFESKSDLRDYIEPVYQRAYFKTYNRRGETEDFVESDVKSIEFFNKSNNAVALVRTKILDKSSLYVKNKYEKLDWRFYDIDGGWKLFKLTEIDEDVFRDLSEQ